MAPASPTRQRQYTEAGNLLGETFRRLTRRLTRFEEASNVDGDNTVRDNADLDDELAVIQRDAEMVLASILIMRKALRR